MVTVFGPVYRLFQAGTPIPEERLVDHAPKRGFLQCQRARWHQSGEAEEAGWAGRKVDDLALASGDHDQD